MSKSRRKLLCDETSTECTVSGIVMQERYKHRGKHLKEKKKEMHSENVISKGDLKEFTVS